VRGAARAEVADFASGLVGHKHTADLTVALADGTVLPVAPDRHRNDRPAGAQLVPYHATFAQSVMWRSRSSWAWLLRQMYRPIMLARSALPGLRAPRNPFHARQDGSKEMRRAFCVRCARRGRRVR